MGVVAVRYAAHGMPKNINGRLGHVLVVEGCTGFPEILQAPELLLTGLDIVLWLDPGQGAEPLENARPDARCHNFFSSRRWLFLTALMPPCYHSK